MKIFQKIKELIISALALGALSFLVSASAYAAGVPYAIGDVFVGAGGGKVLHYSPTGTLLDTLDTTTGCNEDLGMAFDPGGNLYATASFGSCFPGGHVAKFDNMGNLIGPFGSGYSDSTESIVIDGSNNVYVGQPDGTRVLKKFDSAGTFVTDYSPAIQNRGTDWNDLASDQCTMLYTSEGGSVKSFNVCTSTQNLDFATGLAGPCFALRIRSNGEVMVTCTGQTYRLSSSGATLQTYPIAGESLFAMNLDPDGTHFWTAGYFSHNVYKVDIGTGSGTGAPVFTATSFGSPAFISGLAIFGEPTVAKQEISLKPSTATNEVGEKHTVTATVTSGGNPVPGVVVTFTVLSGPDSSTTGTGTTDTSGQATFTYPNNGTAGTDVIEACFTDTSGAKHCARATKDWVIPTITLTPSTAQNPVGTSHTVTATITLNGTPEPNVLVNFSVSGINAGAIGTCTPPTCMTDASGNVSFTYTSNGLAGTDTIVACKRDTKYCANATKDWTSLPGRMTGGGTIGNKLATHGFELHCDVSQLSNNLEVNWDKGNKFHLDTLTAAGCSDDPSITPNPPAAGFDTYFGKGTGKYNGVSGYTAKWKFTDAGEPGVNDYATITIYDPSNTVVATFSGNLSKGNQQAHNN